jgi:hypothetical protein
MLIYLRSAKIDSIYFYFVGQVEALLISRSKNIVSHIILRGSRDALSFTATPHSPLNGWTPAVY